MATIPPGVIVAPLEKQEKTEFPGNDDTDVVVVVPVRMVVVDVPAVPIEVADIEPVVVRGLGILYLRPSWRTGRREKILPSCI